MGLAPVRTARIALVIGTLLSSARPAGPQSLRTITEPPEFVLQQWTMADGLPQNSVNAIAQTADGYLWLGTFGGLVRFDGSSFRLQEHRDGSGRRIDRVLALAVAPDGSLWIGTEDGLIRRTADGFEDQALPEDFPDRVVRALAADRAGGIWIGTRGGGLARWFDGRMESLRAAEGFTLSSITSFADDADGRIVVNANDRSVFVETSASLVGPSAPATFGAERFVLLERSGARWYSMPTGAIRVDRTSVRRFGSEHGIREPNVMAEDPALGVWIGSLNDGLYHLDPARGASRHYALPSGVEKYRVSAAFVARDGSVWFGTNADGLLRARRPLFAALAAEHGLSHNVATAVYGDAAGTMWVATNCGGVNGIRADGRVTVLKPRLPNDPRGDPCVFALTGTPDGSLWIGTYGGGVTRVRNGREERLRPAGLPDSVVVALFTDRAGHVWVGTNSGGVAELVDGHVVRTITTSEGLAHNSVRTIQESSDGAIWIGTLGGLSRLTHGRLRTFGAPDGLLSSHVRAVHEDGDGTIWVGTYGGGLHRLRDSVFLPVTRQEGLADDVISSIIEDAGYFWMSGNRGIQRVARAALVAVTEGRAARVHAELFGESDGLLNAETNGGFQPAAWRDAQGRLWFPTVLGVARVDPRRLGTPGQTPPVTIEDIVIDGAARGAAEGLRVGPGRPNVEFHYAGLSLTGAEHLSYRYRLENFDTEWVLAGARRVAYYPRLQPGTYRFLVNAANRDGVWHDAPSSVGLTVLAPMRERTWFRLLALTLGALAIVVLVRRRTLATQRRHVAQQEFSRRLIESQEIERSRIARELHDGFGQELLVVKNRALLALRAAGLQDPVREQLTQLSEVISSSLDGLRELAHNLTPHQLVHLGLSASLRALAESVSATTSVRCEAEVDEIDDLLPHDVQLNLYRTVQEGVANIVRHAQARVATIRVRREEDALRVTVRDDGRGFEVVRDVDGRVIGGFGLSGITERVRILGGQFTLRSAPGRGTELEITVPVP